MTAEEKAKAYDEALERAKIWQKHLYEVGDKDYADELNYIFPELVESQDEKVRKWLYGYFRSCFPVWIHPDITCGEILDWLEKQGEKTKPIEGFDTEFERQISHLIASAIDREHKYNEGYVKYVAQSLLGYAKNELKPIEWSEEDEKMYSIVFEEYKNRQYYSHPNFKSHDICGEILGWLKSLKQRYTWKPSDEQMKALDSVINEYNGYPEFDLLVSLKNDLKKL